MELPQASNTFLSRDSAPGFDLTYNWLKSHNLTKNNPIEAERMFGKEAILSIDNDKQMDMMAAEFEAKRICKYCGDCFTRKNTFSKATRGCLMHKGNRFGHVYTCCGGDYASEGCCSAMHTSRNCSQEYITYIPLIFFMSGFMEWPPIEFLDHLQIVRNTSGFMDTRETVLGVKKHM